MLDFRYLAKKGRCVAVGLIKVIAITILTFVLMTHYLKHVSKIEHFKNEKKKDKGKEGEGEEEKPLDLEEVEKQVESDVPEDEKKQMQQGEEDDQVAEMTPYIPDPSLTIPPIKAQTNMGLSVIPPPVLPAVTPPNIREMSDAYFQQSGVDVKGYFNPANSINPLNPQRITLASVGVDMTNPRAQELASLLLERPPLTELLARIEANRPKYGMVVSPDPPPALDNIAEQLNAAFITQTEFVDVVKTSSYLRTMSKADLIARKGIDSKTKQPSADVYYATYISSYVPFTDEQKYKLTQAIQIANTTLLSYPTLFNIKWRLAKIINGLEMSFPHTLKDVIILTDDFIEQPLDTIAKTLIHEKFHVFQRQFSSRITDLVRKLDYTPLSSSQVLMIDYVLRALMRNNPDLDGAIYMYKPKNKVIAQLFNKTSPIDLKDSYAAMISLNTYGTNSELLNATNDALDLPSDFQCQLEHPYEITACLVTELITSSKFYDANKKNKHVQTTVEWINSNLTT